jgi:hypothetical protein
MKFSKTRLRQIIQEELEDHNLLNEAKLNWVNPDGTPNVGAMRAGIKNAGYDKKKHGNLQKWLRKPENKKALTAFRAYFNAHRKSKQPARGAGLVKTDTGQGMTGHTALKKPEDLGAIKPKAKLDPPWKGKPFKGFQKAKDVMTRENLTPSDIAQKIHELQATIAALSKEVRALDLDIVIPHRGGRGRSRLDSAIQSGWSALNHVKRELYKIVKKEEG